LQVRNPGGKKTPQDTIHPTPNLTPIQDINEFMRRATVHRSQGALRDLVRLTNRPAIALKHCCRSFTGTGSIVLLPTHPSLMMEQSFPVAPTSSHIPSIQRYQCICHVISLDRLRIIQSQTHCAIETFTGTTLKAEDVQQYVNHPCNALNLETNAHDSMDKHLAWGIEAKLCDDQVCLSKDMS